MSRRAHRTADFAARSAAAELGDIGIVEALELPLLLIAEQEPGKLDRAAVRWHAVAGARAELLDRRGLERAAVVLMASHEG